MNLETTPEPTIETPPGTTKITGGYLVPTADTHISVWQRENDRLDHDRFLHPFIESKIKPGDTCLDLGAFNGDSALAMSNACGKDGLVIAVEAGPVSELLKYNVSLFPNKNTFAMHAVVGEFAGESTSHVLIENMGASRVSIIPRNELVEGQKYIMSVTIDYLASLAKRTINFLKIDVEGWEVHALVGGSKTLLTHKPLLLIEVNSDALSAQGSNADEIYEILMQFGYKHSILQPDCTLESPMYDIFAYPSEEGIALFK